MFALTRATLVLVLAVSPVVVPVTSPSSAQTLIVARGISIVDRAGDLPPGVAYHVARLVEAHRNYRAHAKSLARLEIARATEDVDTAIAEQMTHALEKDAQMLQEHALAMRALAEGLERWLAPLEKQSREARGTAMAIRSVLAPETSLEAKRDALGAARRLQQLASEMGLLLGGLKQDLRVTTN